MDAGPPFLDRLFAESLLIDTGVDGLYGRSGAFEAVVTALDDRLLRDGATRQTEVMRFRPA